VGGTLTLTNGQLTIGGALLSIGRPIGGTLSNLVSGPTSSIAVTGALAGIALLAFYVLAWRLFRRPLFALAALARRYFQSRGPATARAVRTA